MDAANNIGDGERYFRITASQLRKLVNAKIHSTKCMRPECMQYYDFCHTFIHKTAVFFDEIYKQFAEQDKLFIELLTIVNKICTNFALQMHFKLPYSSFERKKKIHEVAVMLKARLNKMEHPSCSNANKLLINSTKHSSSSKEGRNSVCNSVELVNHSTSVLKSTTTTRKRKFSSSANALSRTVQNITGHQQQFGFQRTVDNLSSILDIFSETVKREKQEARQTGMNKTTIVLHGSAGLNSNGPFIANENAEPAFTTVNIDKAALSCGSSESGKSNPSPFVTPKNREAGQNIGGAALITNGSSLTATMREVSSNKNCALATNGDEVSMEIDTCSALAPLLNLLSPQKIVQSPTLQPKECESSSLNSSTAKPSISNLSITSTTSPVVKSNNCHRTTGQLPQRSTSNLRSKVPEVKIKGNLHIAPLSGREYIARYPISFVSPEHPLPFSKSLFPTPVENHNADMADALALRGMYVRLSYKSTSCIVKISVDYSFAAFDQKLYFYYYLANKNVNPWMNGQTFCCTKGGKLSMEMHIEDFVENELLMVSTRIASLSLQYISHFSTPVAIRLTRKFTGIDVDFNQIAFTRQMSKMVGGGGTPRLMNGTESQKKENSVIEVIDLE